MVIQRFSGANPIRRDIEGLRSVAVLAVMLNHTQSGALQGGFVGVDIFFVISGYLIGMHLLQDIEASRFSLLRFYGRRARRLLPALIVMLAAVWGLGWMILSGPEFVDLGKHVAAAALFSNNLLLWSQSGYFDAPAAAKPLLHLWSLGVEEQFYLLVPLLLWVGRAAHRGAVRWVLRLAAVSLLLTVIYPIPSFYLLDTRFWELGVGVGIGYLSLYGVTSSEDKLPPQRARHWETVAFAILLILAAVLTYSTEPRPWSPTSALTSVALILVIIAAIAAPLPVRYRGRLITIAQRHEQPVREIASLLGMALVGASLAAVSSMGWPGPQTVFPVLGTALIIVAGPTASVNKLLGIGPLVFIGGISYPLYLWHWPAIVFWRMFGFDTNSGAKFVPVIAAVLLAWLTKECIEKPFRFGNLGAWKFPMPRVRIIAVGLIVVSIVGASTVATAGYPLRFPPSLRAIANWSAPLPDIDWRRDRCFFGRGSKIEFFPECTPPKRPGVPYILLWGDSHAGHLYPGLSRLHDNDAFDVAQWTSSACPPVRRALLGEDSSCARRREKAINDINRISPDTVLLSAAWEMYLANGTPETTILAAIADDIRWLKERGVRRIVIFGPVPNWETSSDIFTYMLRKRLASIPERLGDVPSDVRHLDAALAAQATAAHVEYISVIDQFCNQSGCLLLGDRSLARPDLLYRDHDHLTPSGSRLLLEASAPKIFDAR